MMDGDHEVYCRREPLVSGLEPIWVSAPQSLEIVAAISSSAKEVALTIDGISEAGIAGAVLINRPTQDDIDQLAIAHVSADEQSRHDIVRSNGGGGDSESAVLSCLICQKIYTTKNILNRHLKIKHDISVTSSYRSLHCPVQHCFRNFNFMSHLRRHIAIDHGNRQVEVVDVVYLNSEAEFGEWKLSEERATMSKYIKRHGRRRQRQRCVQGSVHVDTNANANPADRDAVVEIEEYMCNRSGFQDSGKSRGLRRSKVNGSVKMNSMCPSAFTAYFRLGGRVEVKYFPTHVGHDKDRQHLCLTKSERLDVERLIADGASVDSILDAVRGEREDETLVALASNYIKSAKCVYDMMVDEQNQVAVLRDSVPERQDGEETGPQKARYLKSRVAMLIKELQELGPDNPMILDEVESTDDELLVFLMSEFQARLLAEFGHEGVVSIDRVSSASYVALSLTYVSIILPPDQSAFPCAFCIHVDPLCLQSPSSMNCTQITRFLQAINSRTGLLKPRLLITGEYAAAHFECWTNSMLPPDAHVMSPWAVDRDWRSSLWIASKQLAKQVVVYKSLHRLLTEPDRLQFNRLRVSFVRRIGDGTYGKMFLKYFKHAYLNSEQTWAYSFQSGDHRQRCIRLEALHKSLSTMLADSRTINLDVVFHVVLRLVRERCLSRTDLLRQDEIDARTTKAFECHDVVAHLDESATEIVEVVANNQWLVRSTDGGSRPAGDYIVHRVTETCPVPRGDDRDCGIRCSRCQLCVHGFLCTCIDSVVRADICKHVHLVAKMLRSLTDSSTRPAAVAPAPAAVAVDDAFLQESSENGIEIIMIPDDHEEDRVCEVIVNEVIDDLVTIRSEIASLCAKIVDGLNRTDDVSRLNEIRDATRMLSESLDVPPCRTSKP